MDTAEIKTANASLVATVVANPVVVFTDKERQEKFFADIKAEVEAHVPDITTAKGREEIKSLAFKVTKCKTGIDAAGKKLNEDARKHINAVDAARRDIWDRLEALSTKAREPLTRWEEAERLRVAKVDQFFVWVAGKRIVGAADTSADIAARLAEVEAVKIDPAAFADRAQEAGNALSDTADVLTAAHMRIALEETERAEAERRAEADRAELARLRAAEEERRRAEQERAAAEAELARVKAEEEARAREAEKARQDEAERLARIEREAADKARVEAEAAARAEQEAKDREYEAAIAEANRKAAEERRRAEQAEAAQKAEADRIEAERLQKERADAAAKAADEKRQRDQKHRTSIMTAAKEALMQHADITEEVAKRVVLAITGGNVPSVTIGF